MYSTAKFYHFPKSQPFSGSYFFNPYETLNGGENRIKANFHAHAHAWGKLTNGHNSDEEVYSEYRKNGYTIAGISNYHILSDFAKDTAQIHIPEYEHGYNILKSHYLAIDPKRVSYFDFPLMQSTSMQQNIIEGIHENDGLVVMAHPNLGARSSSDMNLLCNYEFTEVLSHFRNSCVLWDQALSAGRLSWIMSNDDTHNVNDGEAFKFWNEIYIDSMSKTSVLNQLEKGMHYAIESRTQGCDTRLELCKVKDDTLYVRFEQEVNRFEVSCQNGTMITMLNDSREIKIPLLPEYQYVRIVAHKDESIAYLNPIVRCAKNELPYQKKFRLSTNHIKTWSFRIGMYLLILLQCYWIYKLFKRKRAII